MNRRTFFGAAMVPLLGAISKQWHRPEWKPAHATRIHVFDDIAPAWIVVDRYCPLADIVVMSGSVFCAPENAPPWPADTSVQWGGSPRFAAWTMPT